MPQYKVTTPATPRAPGRPYADFQAASEHGTIYGVGRTMEPHAFKGCTVHCKRAGNHWELIFDSSMRDDDDCAAYWTRVSSQ